ncbi:peroxisomal multifunctional enzyme A [Cyclospora cayetanensis]|uniref:Peroxisomal multifunctional enzyme A n=1 Tax=Cyclospora cayetanensis TaxID=88456 RepID=A0A6P6S1H3_9EIME|nr:peroxisomal multifunctional enzyme A [Cyclospora cayetanensis]
MKKRFDGQVAVITGSGGGLGRAYALAFAARGAKVVVNDLGVALAGDVGTPERIRPADAVVAEIRKAGGEAVANYDDVLSGSRIVEVAIKTWGRIDILVNNAGILRDSSFAKMSERDWDQVMQIHVKGAYLCTKAAWPHMVKQGYGRIVNTASASGLYGNFGQANYGAAKMALVGMTRTLAKEGAKYNIHVNCIAPLAGTRMTEKILPPSALEALKPECVAPVVLFLASRECTESGQIFEVGAGWVAAVRWQRSPGKVFPSSYTLEDLTREWQQVVDFRSDVSYPTSLQDSLVMASQQMSTEMRQQPAEPKKPSDTPADAAPGTKSAKIFRMIAAYLERATDAASKLKSKVNSCFHFEISPKQGQPPTLKWTIDLRAESGGKAMEGHHGTADATFIMADEVFALICLGRLNPQVAFLQGKMKIRGSMGKATKFTPDLFPSISAEMLSLDASQAVEHFLKSVAPPAPETTDSAGELSPEAMKLQSAKLFPYMKDHLKSQAGSNLVKQVGCVYRVDLIPTTGGAPCTLYINLKRMPPTVRELPNSTTEPFDCCFTLKDDVFFKLATGKMNPQMAYLQGKMKIKGSTQAAMKFTKDMFPKISKL